MYTRNFYVYFLKNCFSDFIATLKFRYSSMWANLCYFWAGITYEELFFWGSFWVMWCVSLLCCIWVLCNEVLQLLMTTITISMSIGSLYTCCFIHTTSVTIYMDVLGWVESDSTEYGEKNSTFIWEEGSEKWGGGVWEREREREVRSSCQWCVENAGKAFSSVSYLLGKSNMWWKGGIFSPLLSSGENVQLLCFYF